MRLGRQFDYQGILASSEDKVGKAVGYLTTYLTKDTQLDAANVRRAFRQVTKAAGLEPDEWTPRELRHSFVSLLSDAGLPLENISRLVGHSGSTVTELVYRKAGVGA